MPARFSDPEIDRMVLERKPLPGNFHARVHLRSKRGHKEREVDVTGESGAQYQLILRQSDFNPLDLSIILAVNRPIRISCSGCGAIMVRAMNTQIGSRVILFTISISIRPLSATRTGD